MAPPERSARTAILVLSMALLALGSCGINAGLTGLTTEHSVAGEGSQADGAVLEVSEATANTANTFQAALLEAPQRRPLAAANVVVSALLVFAALSLLARRVGAPWWIRQAAIANCVWIAAEATSQCAALAAAAPRLTEALRTEWTARLASAEEAGDLPMEPGGLLWVFGATIVAFAILRVLVFAVLARRAGRQDVADQLGPATEAP